MTDLSNPKFDVEDGKLVRRERDEDADFEEDLTFDE